MPCQCRISAGVTTAARPLDVALQRALWRFLGWRCLPQLFPTTRCCVSRIEEIYNIVDEEIDENPLPMVIPRDISAPFFRRSSAEP